MEASGDDVWHAGGFATPARSVAPARRWWREQGLLLLGQLPGAAKAKGSRGQSRRAVCQNPAARPGTHSSIPAARTFTQTHPSRQAHAAVAAGGSPRYTVGVTRPHGRGAREPLESIKPAACARVASSLLTYMHSRDGDLAPIRPGRGGESDGPRVARAGSPHIVQYHLSVRGTSSSSSSSSSSSALASILARRHMRRQAAAAVVHTQYRLLLD